MQALWTNFGVVDGTDHGFAIADSAQYTGFLSAVAHLGNIMNEDDPSVWVYGVDGFTDEMADPVWGAVTTAGMYQMPGFAEVIAATGPYLRDQERAVVALGSYLVAPSAVPVPAAGWLFMTALVGLVGKKRLARR